MTRAGVTTWWPVSASGAGGRDDLIPCYWRRTKGTAVRDLEVRELLFPAGTAVRLAQLRVST
jgi:hypothetical protein